MVQADGVSDSTMGHHVKVSSHSSEITKRPSISLSKNLPLIFMDTLAFFMWFVSLIEWHIEWHIEDSFPVSCGFVCLNETHSEE